MYLEDILAVVREQVEESRRAAPEVELAARIAELPHPRDLAVALSAFPGPTVIAEVKRASPSRGDLRPDLDPAALARAYAAHGAAAISVLMERCFFKARPTDLPEVRAQVDLPILYKGFVLDPYQLLEARALGADAVLLIVAVLGKALKEFLERAGELGLSCLVEVHRAEELAAAVDAGAGVIGVNNRDLITFRTDPETAHRLIPQIPADRVAVAESGVRDRAGVLAARDAGARAVLVGEALVTHPDPGAKLEELRGVDQDLRHPGP